MNSKPGSVRKSDLTSLDFTTAGKIRVLVADRDNLASRLLTDRLRKHKRFEVTECPEPPSGVLAAVKKVVPSVVLVSAILGDAPKGGLKVLSELHTSFPSVRAIMLLDRPERHLVVEAFCSGAKGVYIRSRYHFAALCKCVHRVHQGQVWADSQQLEFVLEAFSSASVWLKWNPPNGSQPFSKRESDVVRLITNGFSNRETAKELGLSEHTIKNYVFRVFDKVGVSNRVELVHYALAHRELLVDGPAGLLPEAMVGSDRTEQT